MGWQRCPGSCVVQGGFEYSGVRLSSSTSVHSSRGQSCRTGSCNPCCRLHGLYALVFTQSLPSCPATLLIICACAFLSTFTPTQHPCLTSPCRRAGSSLSRLISGSGLEKQPPPHPTPTPPLSSVHNLSQPDDERAVVRSCRGTCAFSEGFRAVGSWSKSNDSYAQGVGVGWHHSELFTSLPG